MDMTTGHLGAVRTHEVPASAIVMRLRMKRGQETSWYVGTSEAGGGRPGLSCHEKACAGGFSSQPRTKLAGPIRDPCVGPLSGPTFGAIFARA